MAQSWSNGRSRNLKREVPVCTLLMYVLGTAIRRTLCPLGMLPPTRKLDLLRSFLVQSWGEIARVGWPNLSIEFEASNHLQNSKTWLCFTLQRLKSSWLSAWSMRGEKKTFVITSYKLLSYWYHLASMQSEQCMNTATFPFKGLHVCLQYMWAVVYVATFAQTY